MFIECNRCQPNYGITCTTQKPAVYDNESGIVMNPGTRVEAGLVVEGDVSNCPFRAALDARSVRVGNYTQAQAALGSR